MSLLNVLRLSSQDPHFESALQQRLSFSEAVDANVEKQVASIIQEVRHRGDEALLDYTRQWDQPQVKCIEELRISHQECLSAFEQLPEVQQKALQTAAQRIETYHVAQKRASGESWSYRDEQGNLLGQKVTPLDRVGIYVPGGKAAYPSSVLMNAIVAHVAGVQDIIMVVPTPKGEKNPLVLAAAYVARVHQIWAIGGAQAVAALAYGTASIGAVDKITGPGNAYVASAKRQVFGRVGIDMIAGPSEIVVIADGSTPPEWVAMDLLSQAEHDEWAQSILISPEESYLDAVQAEIQKVWASLPRRDIISRSIQDRALFIAVPDMSKACELSNHIAPEHLEIASQEPQKWEPLLRHAGAIFMGAYTSESLGDYCAGPNHVLPTSRTARFSSPLGVYDFQKRTSLIQVQKQGAQALGLIAAELAYGEGLQAHARAAELRLDPVPDMRESFFKSSDV